MILLTLWWLFGLLTVLVLLNDQLYYSDVTLQNLLCYLFIIPLGFLNIIIFLECLNDIVVIKRRE